VIREGRGARTYGPDHHHQCGKAIGGFAAPVVVDLRDELDAPADCAYEAEDGRGNRVAFLHLGSMSVVKRLEGIVDVGS
jgi:hypothetical protein